MLKVMDIFQVGNGLSVTLDGETDKVTNGCKLIDGNGNTVVVKSVAMIRHNDPEHIDKNIIVLVDKCDIAIGSIFSIA